MSHSKQMEEVEMGGVEDSVPRLVQTVNGAVGQDAVNLKTHRRQVKAESRSFTFTYGHTGLEARAKGKRARLSVKLTRR